MVPVQLANVVHHIRRLAAVPDPHGKGDGPLLREFHERKDQAAFARLVERHGPLVLRVCRHVLGHEHDAEDAFQATFLVLARRAASIRKPEALAAWLHGVARRIAMQAKRNAARRRARERQVTTVAVSKPCADLAWHDVQAVLDDEIQRLPELYRTPFVLCVLQGQGRADVARRLGVKEGTVWSRLAEARKRLQARLIRRGVELGTVLAAAHLVEQTGRAAVPTALRIATIGAVAEIAAGAKTTLSTEVAALVEGALKSMTSLKAKAGVAVLLFLGVLGTGSGVLFSQAQQASPQAAKDKVHAGAGVVETAEAPQGKSFREDVHGDPLPEAALARLGTVRFRQGSSSHVIRFSRDGKTLLLGGSGRPAGLWDAVTGKEIRQFGPVPFSISDAALSPDGNIVAVASAGAALWDVRANIRPKELETRNDFVTSLAFAPDGKTLATGTQQGVNLWDVAACMRLDWDPNVQAAKKIRDPRKIRELKHGAQVRNLAFLCKGKIVISAGEDGTIRSWDTATGKELRRWETTKRYFHTLAASPTSGLFAHAGSDRALRLFDCISGKETQLMKPDPLVYKLRDPATGKETAIVEPVSFGALAFSPDGNQLASGNWERSMRLWNPSTGKETFRWQTNRGSIHTLTYTSDGKQLVSSGHDSGIQWWDATTGEEKPPPFPGHPARVETMTFSRDGKELVSCGADRTFFRWDVASGRPRSSFRLARSAGAALSPDMRKLVTSDLPPDYKFGDPFSLRLRDAVTGKELKSLGAIPWAHRVAFAPDGKTVAVTEMNLNDRKVFISVRDAQTGQQRHRFEKNGQRLYFSLTFSPDGKKLAAGSWDTQGPNFRLWDLDTGKQLASCEPDHWVNSIAFSSDGKLVALGSGGDFKSCVTVWDLASAAQVGKFAHPGSSFVAAFSPSGRFLASGATMGSLTNIPGREHNLVRVWEIVSGKQVAEFAGHHSGVSAVAFAPDGKTLASGSGDSTILIWDLIGKLRNHDADRPLKLADLETRWADLAGTDAAKAYRGIGDLARSGDAAVAYLKTRLTPVPIPDAAVVRRAERLVMDLNRDTFAVRQKAAGELEKLGGSAVSALRKTLAGRPSLEVRRRVEKILAGLAGKEAPFYLRWSRALEALELTATPAARALIQSLSRGDPEAWLTREAAMAGKRLEAP